MSEPETLRLSSTDYIAYHKSNGKTNQPGVIFLGGFKSDMNGTKALALDKFCKDKELSFIRFDYMGHGQSSGQFTDGTIGQWKDNALAVLDKLTEGPQILVGSSLGGWLMLLVALARPERIVGLIGVASAPDFTEKLIWDKLDEKTRKELVKNGQYQLNSEFGESPYPITLKLIEEARNHLLLNKEKLPINVPVRLIHGMNDQDVPCDFSVKISERVTSDNVCVSLVPFGDHRMSTEDHLALLCNTLQDMVEKYTETR